MKLDKFVEDLSTSPKPVKSRKASQEVKAQPKCTPNTNKQSFSYLNLLNSGDRQFPHRTQAMIDSTTRKVSFDKSRISNSLEYLCHTSKSNLMVRSNPIGLLEPSIKRDGYAVGRDGSFYRSTEHIYSTGCTKSRATPERECKERRSSLSALTNIRSGSGIIATGKPVNAFLPFGFTAAKSNGNGNKISGNKSNNNRVVPHAAAAKEITGEADATTFIQKGIKEIETLTSTIHKSMRCSKSTVVTTTVLEQTSCTKSDTEMKKATLSSPFAAVDVMLKSSLAVTKDEPIQFTFTMRPRGARSQSLCRTTTLPEQDVTISLPASARCSRDTSVDREAISSNNNKLKRQRRSSSIEVFNGTYDMKVPNPKSKRKMSAEITEVKSNFAVYENKISVESEEMTQEARNGGEDKNIMDDVRMQKVEIEESVPNAVVVLKSSKCSSNDVINDHANGNINVHGVGEALKGLTVALESLQQQQYNQKSKLLNGDKKSVAVEESNVEVTVSLRGSRACSPASSHGSAVRSRRNSMDLYSADVKVHLKKNKNDKSTVETTSSCHIRCEDSNKISDLKLCGRCHNPDHLTNSCRELGDLLCPRCLEWDHWEDTCPAMQEQCSHCGSQGHRAKIHEVLKFNQRRAVVDHLGWQPFQPWFYEERFRSWWQLNGCVGVPLYKIYPRNTEWRIEMGPLDENWFNDEEQHGLVYRPKPPKRQHRNNICNRGQQHNKLEREDSIEELLKKINAPRKRVSLEDDNDNSTSGRSTPEHLKNYSGKPEDVEGSENSRRVRTYSETLKLLDADILAELNVN